MATRFIIPTLSSHPAITARRALYTYLCELAEAGEPCPRGDVLAARFGRRTSTIGRMLADLCAEGLIAVERRGIERRITIHATGRRTAEPVVWCPKPAPFRPKRPVRAIAAKAIHLSGRPAKDVLGRSRYREHVRVRQVIFAFAVREGWGITHTGRVLGYDHSTVKHGRKVLPERALVEPETAALIEALARELPPLPEIAA